MRNGCSYHTHLLHIHIINWKPGPEPNVCPSGEISPTGKFFRKSRGPNPNALVSTACLLLISVTFLLLTSGSNFTKFFAHAGENVAHHPLIQFLISRSVAKIFAVKIWSCPKLCQFLHLFFALTKFGGVCPKKISTSVIMPVSWHVTWQSYVLIVHTSFIPEIFAVEA